MNEPQKCHTVHGKGRSHSIERGQKKEVNKVNIVDDMVDVL
jgi:hypothetical protein